LAAARGWRILSALGVPPVPIVRFFVVIAVASAVAIGAIGAGTMARAAVTGADRDAIEATISGQIEAFRRDDGAAAFAYAAPRIRAQFGDPDTFMAMVRGGYAAVYRPQHLRFLALRMNGDEPTQEVLIIGPDGLPYFALYMMERQADGSWRIGGVALVRAEDEET
jgi:hypothetical protein